MGYQTQPRQARLPKVLDKKHKHRVHTVYSRHSLRSNVYLSNQSFGALATHTVLYSVSGLCLSNGYHSPSYTNT
jgi:hypothetical protein